MRLLLHHNPDALGATQGGATPKYFTTCRPGGGRIAATFRIQASSANTTCVAPLFLGWRS